MKGMDLVMKKTFVALLLALSLTTASFAAEKIRMGVTAGPHEEVSEFVKGIAARDGIELEIVVFSDFVLPNAALAEGELDVNSFQHLPYLENMIRDRGYKIKPIGKTILLPMAVYSNKVKSVEEITDGMTTAIPNDPSNGGRALLLLASHGLIKLNPETGLLPSVADIIENPKNLKFIELDAAQLVQSRDDADLAVINSNYAIQAGLIPSRDAMFVEGNDSPYINIIVVREGEEYRPEFKKLLKAYNNDEVKAFVAEKFKGAIICGW